MVAEGLSEICRVRPPDPVEYLGYWLLSYEAREARARGARLESAASENLRGIAAEVSLEAGEESTGGVVESVDPLAGLEGFDFLEEFLGGGVCEALVEGGSMGFESVWFGRVIGEESERRVKVISSGGEGQRSKLVGAELPRGRGACWAAVDEGSVFVEDVVLDPRVHFFGIPRFGSFLAVRFYLPSFLTGEMLQLALTGQKEGENTNNGESTGLEAKAREAAGAPRIFVACFDSLGADKPLDPPAATRMIESLAARWDAHEYSLLMQSAAVYRELRALEATVDLPMPHRLPESKAREHDPSALERDQEARLVKHQASAESAKRAGIKTLVDKICELKVSQFPEVAEIALELWALPASSEWTLTAKAFRSLWPKFFEFQLSGEKNQPLPSHAQVENLRARAAKLDLQAIDAFCPTLGFIARCIVELIEMRINDILLRNIAFLRHQKALQAALTSRERLLARMEAELENAKSDFAEKRSHHRSEKSNESENHENEEKNRNTDETRRDGDHDPETEKEKDKFFSEFDEEKWISEWKLSNPEEPLPDDMPSPVDLDISPQTLKELLEPYNL